MRPPIFPPAIVRLSGRPAPAPDDEPSMPARPRGSRRPHTDDRVARVRHLIEQTTLTYGEIAARTGVGRASICRWTRDGGWQRPLFAPRATDTVPRWRASTQLKRRTLAARLEALAERHIRELEAARVRRSRQARRGAGASEDGEARRAGPQPAPHASWPSGEPMRPIIELCLADVDLRRAPRAALDDFLKHRAPPARRRSRPGAAGAKPLQERRVSSADAGGEVSWLAISLFSHKNSKLISCKQYTI